MKEFTFKNLSWSSEEKTYLEETKYMNGAKAIKIISEDCEPFATLTVNIPEVIHELEEDEILVKTWSENEEIANELRNSELFTDTGKRVSTGFVQAEIWKVKCGSN
uniref:Uncharacterized protein n=1 Tax=viral metagenome TaxID=1070528 RepID=A0A6M3IK18_9ZZZZ